MPLFMDVRIRSPGGRISTPPSRNTPTSSADWPTYMITSARRIA